MHLLEDSATTRVTGIYVNKASLYDNPILSTDTNGIGNLAFLSCRSINYPRLGCSGIAVAALEVSAENELSFESELSSGAGLCIMR